MGATTEIQSEVLDLTSEELEVEEDLSFEFPPREEFVRCDARSCGARSYGFYKLGDKLLSYCAHHSRKYHDKIMDLPDTEFVDYSEDLLQR